jgi:hypothetical protein
LNQRLEVTLEDAVKLERLPRREPQGLVCHAVRERIQHPPLRRRAPPARQSHAQHERERLLFARLLQRVALVAVVLEVQPMKLGQLRIVLRNRSRRRIPKIIRNRAAQVLRGRLDHFIGSKRLGSGGVGAHVQGADRSATRAHGKFIGFVDLLTQHERKSLKRSN